MIGADFLSNEIKANGLCPKSINICMEKMEMASAGTSSAHFRVFISLCTAVLPNLQHGKNLQNHHHGRPAERLKARPALAEVVRGFSVLFGLRVATVG